MSKIILRLKRKDCEAEVSIEKEDANYAEAKELLCNLLDLSAEIDKKKPKGKPIVMSAHRKDDFLDNI